MRYLVGAPTADHSPTNFWIDHVFPSVTPPRSSPPSLSNQHNNFCKLSVIIYPHHHRSFEHHLHPQLKKEKIHLQNFPFLTAGPPAPLASPSPSSDHVILMSGTISIKSTRLTYMMATNAVVGLIARETTSSKQKKSK
ncbi:hypothetical protein L1987_87943 [Smallanthus sonchifolius]|nr:hypothetical protein L1987_87943 [Smallanthus sonchifolius]